MFDRENWHNQIVENLNAFARNPWQEVQISGSHSMLGYLAMRTIEPFLEAFMHEPINAVIALSSITREPGADRIILRASQLYFQGAHLLEREMHTLPTMRSTLEQLMVTLNIVHLARQRLNSNRDDWFRQTLIKELEVFDTNQFVQIRHLLDDPGWKWRHDAIAGLKHRHGQFTPAELILLSEGLKDSSSDVRATAARILGEFAHTPPVQLIKTLVHVALHDCDMKARNAAARSLGGLSERIASPEILDLLAEHFLDPDCFVRSATAMLVSELGEMAAIPAMIHSLIRLLKDSDPYAREAAAIALGRLGPSAYTKEVFAALTEAGQDFDPAVHEAAVESLIQLRKLRVDDSLASKTQRLDAAPTRRLDAPATQRLDASDDTPLGAPQTQRLDDTSDDTPLGAPQTQRLDAAAHPSSGLNKMSKEQILETATSRRKAALSSLRQRLSSSSNSTRKKSGTSELQPA